MLLEGLFAARLKRSSFYNFSQKNYKKAGAEGGKAAQIIFKI